MPIRRRLVPALAVLLLVAVGGGAGAALALGAGSPARPVAVERAHHYWGTGPSADYDGDSGGIGEVPPFRVAVPEGGGSYDAVVTVSLQYRTRGPGPFTAALSVVEAGAVPGDHGLPGEPVRPRERRLGPSSGTSTTFQFVVPELAAGTSYDVRPAVNAVFAGERRNLVATRRVVLTVDLEHH